MQNSYFKSSSKISNVVAIDVYEKMEAVRALAYEIAEMTLAPGGIPDEEDWEMAEILCDYPDPEEYVTPASADKSHYSETPGRPAQNRVA